MLGKFIARVPSSTRSPLFSSISHHRNCRVREFARTPVGRVDLSCLLVLLVLPILVARASKLERSKLEDGGVDEDGDVDDAPISARGDGRDRPRAIDGTAAGPAPSATSSSPRSPSGTSRTHSTSSERSAATTWGRRSLDLLSKLRYSGARESQITHSSARSQPHASTGPFVHPKNAPGTRADGSEVTG